MAISTKHRLVAVSISIALAAGYIVQDGNTYEETYLGTNPYADFLDPRTIEPTSAGVLAQPAAPTGEDARAPLLPRVPAQALTPAPRLPDAQDMRLRSARDSGARAYDLPDQNLNAFGAQCAMRLMARDIGEGMTRLSLRAPCHLNERVEIRHEGLDFAVMTSTTGAVDLDVPALSGLATYSIGFANGEEISATAQIAGLDRIDRVAVSWQGKAALTIHAFEFGAGYGDAGHVWQDAPRNAEAARRAHGGFLTHLGDADLAEPRLSQVYSFPTRVMRDPGVIRLSIEAEVTPYTCGKSVSARTAELRPGEAIQWVGLTLSMPGCEAVGDYLVLKNLLQDLIVARN